MILFIESPTLCWAFLYLPLAQQHKPTSLLSPKNLNNTRDSLLLAQHLNERYYNSNYLHRLTEWIS